MGAGSLRDGLVFALSVGLGFAACASASGSTGASSAQHEPSTPALPGLPPKAPMNLEQARRYVLALVNHDRAEHGLAPVVMDDAASRAGQRHAEDMARVGYTAHWGSDGSVPEQRYSEAGGSDHKCKTEGWAHGFPGYRLEFDGTSDPAPASRRGADGRRPQVGSDPVGVRR